MTKNTNFLSIERHLSMPDNQILVLLSAYPDKGL